MSFVNYTFLITGELVGSYNKTDIVCYLSEIEVSLDTCTLSRTTSDVIRVMHDTYWEVPLLILPSVQVTWMVELYCPGPPLYVYVYAVVRVCVYSEIR